MRKPDKNFITVKELIELAIDFEIESAKFYRKLQKKTRVDAVLQLLKLLEEQEWEHEKILRQYEIGPEPHAILQFGPSFSFAMPAISPKDIGIFELLDIAKQREKRTAEIYENSASLISGDLHKLLGNLATFEHEHEDKLIALKSYLKSEEIF
jgi:rubrerythrin